jgi:hypothetical protein
VKQAFYRIWASALVFFAYSAAFFGELGGLVFSVAAKELESLSSRRKPAKDAEATLI